MSTQIYGNFTPTIAFGTTDPDTLTYTTQKGRQHRLIKESRFEIDIEIDTFTIGSAAGTVSLTGLNRAAASNGTRNIPVFTSGINLPNDAVGVFLEIAASGITGKLVVMKDAAASADLDPSALVSGGIIRVSGTYFTD